MIMIIYLLLLNVTKGITIAQITIKKMTTELTPELLNTFLTTDTLGKHAVLEAVAGAGKSYQMKQALELMGEKDTVLFVAFNEENVIEFTKELEKLTLKASVTPMTLHSLALKLLTPKISLFSVAAYKFALVKSQLGNSKYAFRFSRAVAELCSKAQNTLTNYESIDELKKLIIEYNITRGLEPQDTDRIAQFANHLLKGTVMHANLNMKQVIDFDDMAWLPITMNYDVPQTIRFDWIFLDECQDINEVQLCLIEKLLAANPSTRVLAAGDDRQSIYGFRGAKKAIERLKSKLTVSGKYCEFSLPVCRRCPVSHLHYASRVVPYIRPMDGAKQGVVEKKQFGDVVIREGDWIICRNSKPIIAIAYQLFKKAKPVKIVGEPSLKNTLKAFFNDVLKNKEDPKIEADKMEKSERDAAFRNCETSKLPYITDFYACVRQLSRSGTIEEILSFIAKVFIKRTKKGEKDTTTICLSTIHRCKGATVKRVVFLLAHNQANAPNENKFDAEELNLLYVACTRATETLIFAEYPGLERSSDVASAVDLPKEWQQDTMDTEED
jgi:superfamily I DNA/RNA helicase